MSEINKEVENINDAINDFLDTNNDEKKEKKIVKTKRDNSIVERLDKIIIVEDGRELLNG